MKIKPGDKVNFTTKYGDHATGVYVRDEEMPGIGLRAVVSSHDCFGEWTETPTLCTMQHTSMTKAQ